MRVRTLTSKDLAAKRSQFPRPNGLLQFQQPVAQAIDFADVNDPVSLSLAIGNAMLAGTPRGVRVTQSMTLIGKINIPAAATGIYLTAAPGVVLYTQHDDFALEVAGFPFILDKVRFSRIGGSVSGLFVGPTLTKFDAGQVFTMRDCAFDGYTSPIAIGAGGSGILRVVLENIMLTADSTMSVTMGSSNTRIMARGIYPANPNTQSIDFTISGNLGDYEVIDAGTAGTLTASGTRNTFKSVRNPGGLASTMTSGYLINVQDTAGASGTDVIL